MSVLLSDPPQLTANCRISRASPVVPELTRSDCRDSFHGADAGSAAAPRPIVFQPFATTRVGRGTRYSRDR